MKYLSDAELYFSAGVNKAINEISVYGEDYRHIVKVMRHSNGDKIYITNGQGEIFLSVIKKITKDSLTAEIKEVLKYKNEFSDLFFCFPKLKSNDRLEFALEKCTELGITNFIISGSERAIIKSSKINRWQKIVISAMKQSLRSFLPGIYIVNSIKEIFKFNGRKILLDQNSELKISKLKLQPGEKYFFVFGPEGGLTKDEIGLFDEKYKLADNRLRTETAVIKCASIIVE